MYSLLIKAIVLILGLIAHANACLAVFADVGVSVIAYIKRHANINYEKSVIQPSISKNRADQTKILLVGLFLL